MIKESPIFARVYTWMFVGLIITFGIGYYLSSNVDLMYKAMGYWIPMIIVLLAIAFLMGFAIKKLPAIVTKILFIVYSFITGVTFSTIFAVYEVNSVIMIFLVTAILFLLFALYGYFSKADLLKMGPILFMLLIGVIISSIVNIFIGSTTFEIIISALCIALFLGYVAYDMKRIRAIVEEIGEEKGAIYGAFQLYLDFINIFIRLLYLFGKKD